MENTQAASSIKWAAILKDVAKDTGGPCDHLKPRGRRRSRMRETLVNRQLGHNILQAIRQNRTKGIETLRCVLREFANAQNKHLVDSISSSDEKRTITEEATPPLGRSCLREIEPHILKALSVSSANEQREKIESDTKKRGTKCKFKYLRNLFNRSRRKSTSSLSKSGERSTKSPEHRIANRDSVEPVASSVAFFTASATNDKNWNLQSSLLRSSERRLFNALDDTIAWGITKTASLQTESVDAEPCTNVVLETRNRGRKYLVPMYVKCCTTVSLTPTRDSQRHLLTFTGNEKSVKVPGEECNECMQQDNEGLQMRHVGVHKWNVMCSQNLELEHSRNSRKTTKEQCQTTNTVPDIHLPRTWQETSDPPFTWNEEGLNRFSSVPCKVGPTRRSERERTKRASHIHIESETQSRFNIHAVNAKTNLLDTSDKELGIFHRKAITSGKKASSHYIADIDSIRNFSELNEDVNSVRMKVRSQADKRVTMADAFLQTYDELLEECEDVSECAMLPSKDSMRNMVNAYIQTSQGNLNALPSSCDLELAGYSKHLPPDFR